MHEDYNETLRNRYEELRKQTRAGTLPLDERIKAIDEAVSDYVAAQDEDFEYKHDKGGHVPIQLRNDSLLDLMADLLMHEYLTWSHQDKMNIVENPILSRSQTEYRNRREKSLSDVYTGSDDETIGRYTDHDGIKRRIYDYMTPNKDYGLIPTEYLDLYTALDNAGLTDRQRQTIELVYFEGLTQEDAAKRVEVTQQAIDQFIKLGLSKIKKYFTESTC